MQQIHLRRALPWSRSFRLYDPAGARIDGRLKLPRMTPSAKDGTIRTGDDWLDLRIEGHELWLVDDENTLAYARGASFRWAVLAGDFELEIVQKRIGWTESAVKRNGVEIGVVRARHLARSVTIDMEESLDLPLLLFVTCVALREWRETTGSTTGTSQSEA